jgi:hypothetical protein
VVSPLCVFAAVRQSWRKPVIFGRHFSNDLMTCTCSQSGPLLTLHPACYTTKSVQKCSRKPISLKDWPLWPCCGPFSWTVH